MGLDMYLEKRRFIHYDEKDILEIKFPGINPKNVREIIEEVGYWRKVNAIHAWFVDNKNDGKDDCGSYYIDLKDLENLLKDVNMVLEDRELASSILPVMPGFFFGSYEYDEWYFDSLQHTKEILENVIKNWDERASYYYTASW